MMTIIRTGPRQHTVVQEPTRGLLCISGECGELIFRQIVLMRISAATLIFFALQHGIVKISRLRLLL
jgi:hypothetical protein